MYFDATLIYLLIRAVYETVDVAPHNTLPYNSPQYEFCSRLSPLQVYHLAAWTHTVRDNIQWNLGIRDAQGTEKLS